MTMTIADRRQPETLTLGLDVEDVELPFGEAQAAPVVDEVTALRRALVDALAHVERGTVPHGSRVRAWRELAGTAYVDNLTPEERRDDGIARAAARWTDDEVLAVDLAIATVAARKVAERAEAAGYERVEPYTDDVIRIGELTTADVWQQLDGTVPITKGIAGRMLAAKSAGLIANTGRTVIAPRESTGPNHGQRLTVWRAL